MAAVLGLTLNKISAERKKNTSGNIEINTQPSIVDVTEIKLPGLSKDLSALSVDFKLNSVFDPDMGHITIDGSILYKADVPDAVLKEWKKTKALPPIDGAIILNHILSKVSIIGLYLSDLLQLPSIVSMPKVELKKNEEKAK